MVFVIYRGTYSYGSIFFFYNIKRSGFFTCFQIRKNTSIKRPFFREIMIIPNSHKPFVIRLISLGCFPIGCRFFGMFIIRFLIYGTGYKSFQTCKNSNKRQSSVCTYFLISLKVKRFSIISTIVSKSIALQMGITGK
ncbi:hypothetical protein D3C80_714250 [compost metagenome]